MVWIVWKVLARYLASSISCHIEELSNLLIGMEVVGQRLENFRKIGVVIVVPPRTGIQRFTWFPYPRIPA
jgi:hypothetical protein